MESPQGVRSNAPSALPTVARARWEAVVTLSLSTTWWACRARSAFWGSPEGQTAPLALLSRSFLRKERGAPSVVGVLIALVELGASIIKPIVTLTQSITKLTVVVERIE